MEFIHDDFLWRRRQPRRLYHGYAASRNPPDYHRICRLRISPLTGGSRTYSKYGLKTNHYKWRAMRANGISDRFCTGDAPPFEKFLAWARTVPFCAAESALSLDAFWRLKRYFDIGNCWTKAAPKKSGRQNILPANQRTIGAWNT